MGSPSLSAQPWLWDRGQQLVVGEAARVIGEGALLATKNRSARLAGEVKAARSRMQPWRDTPEVRELDERLRECGLE